MSHILKATISGLAGKTNNTSIEFDRHLNIIYGLNGSGKTSLLKILHSAMTGDTEILRNVPFNEAEVQIFSITFEKKFTRKIVKQKISLIEDDESTYEVSEKSVAGKRGLKRSESSLIWKESPELEDRDHLTRWSHRYLPTTRLHVAYTPFDRTSLLKSGERLTEEMLDTFFAESIERLWTSYSADILQEVSNAQEKGLASILKAVLSTSKTKRQPKKEINLEVAYSGVKRFLERQGSPRILGSYEQFIKRYGNSASLRRVVRDIFQIEEGINKAMAPRQQLEKLVQRLYSGNKKIAFGDRKIIVKGSDGSEIGLATLSSGEKHLLQIFLETMIVGESSLIIDEPEISMHVDWQNDLVTTLQTLNPDAQLIIATHSPEIMANIPDKNIYSI
jgi:predicted ATPase